VLLCSNECQARAVEQICHGEQIRPDKRPGTSEKWCGTF
jgi:hypothetical protein